MKKPTIQEVTEYCDSRNNHVDGELFWEFYESKGWLVGKAPMKNWKAAVRTWERKDRKSSELTPRQSDVDRRAAEKGLQARPGETWDQFSLRVSRTR